VGTHKGEQKGETRGKRETPLQGVKVANPPQQEATPQGTNRVQNRSPTRRESDKKGKGNDRWDIFTAQTQTRLRTTEQVA